ncbi:MAG: NUDIX domain-containing protein [Aquificaceae bacterium]
MEKPQTPLLAVDAIIRLWDNKGFNGIVLVERLYPPYGFALPGGFVEIGERVEQALTRETKEETGLDVSIKRLFGVYSDPKRDPRFHVVSLVFLTDATGKPKAGDDAKKVYIFKLEELPFDRLVFDHARILMDFLKG